MLKVVFREDYPQSTMQNGLEQWLDAFEGFPCSSVRKASACSAGDLVSVPGSGRSSGEENGNPLQYSCLENSMDRETWRATVHGITRVRQTTFYIILSYEVVLFPWWVSLVAQLVKNPPAMWETWVQSMGWEDPLEKVTSSILVWRIPCTV